MKKRCALCDKHHSLFDEYCQKCRDDLNSAQMFKARKLVMPHDQFVYAISVAGDNTAVVKFGFSNGPSGRLNTLQVGSPVKLEIVAYGHGLRHHEKMIHRRLASDRSHGEWFRRSQAALEVIEAIRSGCLVSFLEGNPSQLRAIRHLQLQSAVI